MLVSVNVFNCFRLDIVFLSIDELYLLSLNTSFKIKSINSLTDNLLFILLLLYRDH